jgi:2,4-dienoyl-CoA reductase-like NADH-dependent reductase (Old Yellow Enzyme family)
VHSSTGRTNGLPSPSAAPMGGPTIVAACRPHGTLVVASLDHAGGQGSSAYSQLPLWAPSRVPEVNSREVPKWMEAADIEAVVAGFATAASLAVEAGCDGVEINAGQHSLVRQFLSGLTNHRGDEWGQDRLLVRPPGHRSGSLDGAVGTPGSSASGCRATSWRRGPASRPRWRRTSRPSSSRRHRLPGGGPRRDLLRREDPARLPRTDRVQHRPVPAVAAAVDVPVVLQGSIVDVGQAEWALGGYDDPAWPTGVEMTRAQIADPDLVAKLQAGRPSSASGRALDATRPARCATPATRSSPASVSRRAGARPKIPTGTHRR